MVSINSDYLIVHVESAGEASAKVLELGYGDRRFKVYYRDHLGGEHLVCDFDPRKEALITRFHD